MSEKLEQARDKELVAEWKDDNGNLLSQEDQEKAAQRLQELRLQTREQGEDDE